ncbi:hypothetical protein EHF33_01420 [Deinococcus psychrotolerans]|uniref:Uncharacterized protein n=1 Tax=Deinococcus psychrotolerans TaxID=2489213 RepID=A0A3G8Y885_9DEIO|nr:hypothetical protein [Deinococcus psychrotolerans]AZI41578.1 hypothetical protein EHF33_01420 [Deinococcus psychrotolerans]
MAGLPTKHEPGAGHLKLGDTLKTASGGSGQVVLLQTVSESKQMYNLTVDAAHTFYVGETGWLVHNCEFSWKLGQAQAHFDKHGGEIVQALGLKSYDLAKYMEDTNLVIKNGTWVPEMNAYVQIIGGKGSAKVLLAGLDRTIGEITTLHVKTISEVSRKAPSLGWKK